ncbi:uncharacterized protein DEA37_0011695, partial [Paragonimus westermani]
QLSLARLTFVSKLEEPATPADCSLVAIFSVLQRVLHRIPAERVRDKIRFSSPQIAFQKKDGCLEASILLHTLLRTARDEARPIAMAFPDISKAFDSVPHDTILRCARKRGLPSPLVRYLTRLYRDSLTIWDDVSVECRRGVRQGDPLSPALFIMATNEFLSYAQPEL